GARGKPLRSSTACAAHGTRETRAGRGLPRKIGPEGTNPGVGESLPGTFGHERKEGLMSEKILLVDDEIAILQGYQRLLHGEFHTSIAVGGPAALVEMEQNGPFSVVVSDMRMPDMDGAQLLAKVKTLYPDTIRVMLTGNADIQTAVRAVNDGNIFRFLTK